MSPHRHDAGDAQRVLVTGFEPFGGEQVNPSWEVARALHGERIAGATVSALCLPCRFGESGEVLARALAQTPVAVVIALGQASSRCDMSVERIAINIDDAPMPDNAGAQPADQPAVPGAPAAYFSSLPIKRIVAAMRAEGVPASVSQTAGTFVCNHLFFRLAHLIATRHPQLRGGFIHMPMLPEQAAAWTGTACLSLDTMVRGVRAAIVATLTGEGAVARDGGTVA
jgi:pyroglutamyl-peptidase